MSKNRNSPREVRRAKEKAKRKAEAEARRKAGNARWEAGQAQRWNRIRAALSKHQHVTMHCGNFGCDRCYPKFLR